MSNLASVIRRFAAHEFAVRRLYAFDPEFRSLCEDFEIASRALAQWHADDAKARDYRRLIGELEDEIAEFIGGLQRKSGERE